MVEHCSREAGGSCFRIKISNVKLLFYLVLITAPMRNYSQAIQLTIESVQFSFCFVSLIAAVHPLYTAPNLQ